MKRPHIPFKARCKVAIRQLGADADDLLCFFENDRLTHSTLLVLLLHRLARKLGCERNELHLDHNPALALRQKTKRGWIPDANDPEFLIYRDKHSHHIKTNVRGDGAQRSDTSERVHQRRLEKNRLRRAGKMKPRTKIKSASKWPPRGSRPFGQS